MTCTPVTGRCASSRPTGNGAAACDGLELRRLLCDESRAAAKVSHAVRSEGEPPWCPRSGRSLGLNCLDVSGGRAFRALLGVVAHLRALGKRLEAVALDRAVVYEQVLTRIIGGDESIPLVGAEPLHSSCGHLYFRRYVHCETRRVLKNANDAKT